MNRQLQQEQITVIPSEPGTYAVSIDEENDKEMFRTPIIAWRCVSKYNSQHEWYTRCDPLTRDGEIGSNDVIVMSNKVVHKDEGIWENLQAYLEDAEK